MTEERIAQIWLDICRKHPVGDATTVSLVTMTRVVKFAQAIEAEAVALLAAYITQDSPAEIAEPCRNGCEYAREIGMEGHSCAGQCQYLNHPDCAPPDAALFDFLEAKAEPGMKWIARPSMTGRGYRLHQDPHLGLHDTPRQAIAAAIASSKEPLSKRVGNG